MSVDHIPQLTTKRLEKKTALAAHRAQTTDPEYKEHETQPIQLVDPTDSTASGKVLQICTTRA